MKQTLVGVSKQWLSVVPFLGINKQDIEMHAKINDESREDEIIFHCYEDEAANHRTRP